MSAMQDSLESIWAYWTREDNISKQFTPREEYCFRMLDSLTDDADACRSLADTSRF